MTIIFSFGQVFFLALHRLSRIRFTTISGHSTPFDPSCHLLELISSSSPTDCVQVCVCVREREKERERVCVCVCVGVCVRVRALACACLGICVRAHWSISHYASLFLTLITCLLFCVLFSCNGSYASCRNDPFKNTLLLKTFYNLTHLAS